MSGLISALRLMELTSARLCDSLRGPADVLSKALSAQTGQAAEAAKTLNSQLDLWHAAWGPADQSLSLSQVRALAEGLPGWVVVDLSALPAQTVFPPPASRILLNVLLLAAESLPAGGHVVLAGAPGDIFIRISGAAAAWPTGLALCLANEAEAQSALADGRSLQMALTAALAHASGVRLSALLTSGTRNEPAILNLSG